MPKNYVYRMHHDTGFAPHAVHVICSLCGCKTSTIEKWATKGSWIIGIGGNLTSKPDMLIYMMQVNDILSSPAFKSKYPGMNSYFNEVDPKASRFLISELFYYLGNRAINLPNTLTHVIAHCQERKLVSDGDINLLKQLLTSKGFRPGFIGDPNNPKRPCNKCTTSSLTARNCIPEVSQCRSKFSC